MAQLKNTIGALLCVICLLVSLTSATTRDVYYCSMIPWFFPILILLLILMNMICVICSLMEELIEFIR